MPNLIYPQTCKATVSHSSNLGTARYDAGEIYSPDTGQWKSKVLDIGPMIYKFPYAYDKSRYRNHGTIVGATWVQNPNGLWSLNFDNVDDNLIVGDVTTLKNLHGALDTTAFKWTMILVGKPNTALPFIYTDNGSSGNVGVWIGVATGAGYFVRISRGSSGNSVINWTSTAIFTPDSNPHHFVFTYDQSLASANAKIYKDSVFVEAGDKTGLTPSTANCTNAPGLFYASNGIINEFSIYYGRAFSQNEISAHYLNAKMRMPWIK